VGGKDVAAPVRLYDVAERRIAYTASPGRDASALITSAFDEHGVLWLRSEDAIWRPAVEGHVLVHLRRAALRSVA
jgi:hypothetical protein